MDTIFALATAAGRAGVAIIRISGPSAVSALEAYLGDVPHARGLRSLRDENGALIDEPLVLRFNKNASFTGEDVIELHLHGSPAVVAAALGLLSRTRDLRAAEAGEFTRRALENGRLDLSQVEGLADLIDAETEAQRKQAVRVLDGALGGLVEAWRRDLIRALALITATIDFADEDVPEDVLPEVRQLLSGVTAGMQRESSGVAAAERVRDGFEVAIVGVPNAGKSTLLNYLAGREAAITSEIAGTTRDVIEVRMDIFGLPVTFLDTAGIREAVDNIEKIGVDLAKRRAEAADLRIVLKADDELPAVEIHAGDIVVSGKSDVQRTDGDAVSGVTGDGVDDLIHRVSSTLQARVASVGVAMRDRHKVAIDAALAHIEQVNELIVGDGSLDFIAEELRLACRAVDMLVGRVDVEDLLDDIFSSFCIGK